MQRGTMILVAIALLAIVYYISCQSSIAGNDPRFVFSEKYRPPQADYKYGLVDTNLVRRVGQFFD